MFRASQITSDETLPGLVANFAESIESLEVIEAPHDTTNWGSGGGTSNDWGTMPSNGSHSKLTIVTESGCRQSYPMAVFFVLTAKLFEAFAANGIRTILVLYLRDDLNYNENVAIICLHSFNFFGQFCPIFGAVVADSYLGNVRTIQLFYYLYGFGWLILISTLLPVLNFSSSFLIIGSLVFIAIGNGSSRACVTSLGAQQFTLPGQAKQLAGYFSLYYFVYYVGICLSKILPPLVRVRVHCFQRNTCYLAVFGVLAGSFFTAWLTFSLGKFFFKNEELIEDNVLLKFYGCIKFALWKRWTSKHTSPQLESVSGGTEKQHSNIAYTWLEYAIGPYDRQFVDKVGQVLKLMVLFLPLPIYFALLTQQDSSWTFQASQMNTRIFWNINIQPDQVKALGPIFLFLLIPLWQYVLRPILYQCFRYELKPLHSVAFGGICAALSFFSAGILEKQIQIKSPRSVSIMWQIPQFFLIMLGELFLSIPGLQFAYTQAPMSMKSVVTAAWFLNNAFGNLIVILCTELRLFETQMKEFFFYAVIMLISITCFMYLAYNYTKTQPLRIHHHHHHHHHHHPHNNHQHNQYYPCDSDYHGHSEETPLIRKNQQNNDQNGDYYCFPDNLGGGECSHYHEKGKEGEKDRKKHYSNSKETIYEDCQSNQTKGYYKHLTEPKDEQDCHYLNYDQENDFNSAGIDGTSYYSTPGHIEFDRKAPTTTTTTNHDDEMPSTSKRFLPKET